MQYQLVFQFRGDSLDDYDAMIALEEALIAELGSLAEVDGHDIGSRETNIFILTSDAESAFQLAKPVLERLHLLGVLHAAYRPVASEDFTVIWPADSQQAFAVA